MRFGIGCEREHTLEEIGQEFDVTRERIRQIEAKALRQLRAPERARQALKTIDRAAIGTIHSYAFTLLKRFPLSAGRRMLMTIECLFLMCASL